MYTSRAQGAWLRVAHFLRFENKFRSAHSTTTFANKRWTSDCEKHRRLRTGTALAERAPRSPERMCLQQLLGPPAWTSARLACASGMTVATTLTWLQSQLCHVSGRSMQPTFVRRQPSEPRCATNPLRPRVQPPLIRPLPCQNNGCSSGEMRDLVFLDRVSARLNLISRGDVVVLRSPDDDALITKRVVAMGGETVRHREHGSRLVRVPTAHLWVEGDNGEVGLAVKKSGPSLGFSWSSALDPILGPSCGVAGALGPVLGAPGRVCPGNNDGSAAAIAEDPSQ